jgi:hypothetical protein
VVDKVEFRLTEAGKVWGKNLLSAAGGHRRYIWQSILAGMLDTWPVVRQIKSKGSTTRKA